MLDSFIYLKAYLFFAILMSLPMVVSTFLSCRMCFEIGMEKANIEIIDKVEGERGVGEGKGSSETAK